MNDPRIDGNIYIAVIFYALKILRQHILNALWLFPIILLVGFVIRLKDFDDSVLQRRLDDVIEVVSGHEVNRRRRLAVAWVGAAGVRPADGRRFIPASYLDRADFSTLILAQHIGQVCEGSLNLLDRAVGLVAFQQLVVERDIDIAVAVTVTLFSYSRR